MSETESPKNDSLSIQPKQQSRAKWLFENVISLLFALLLVFAIRSSVIEAFKIPSGSMIPTLLIGDHIFVNKFAYGFKVPFSDLVSKDPTFIVKRDPPQHGDIIVFMYPKDESFYYIKRVVGVPGDKVELKKKALYINDVMVPRQPLPEARAKAIFSDLDDPKYSPSTLELFEEKVENHPHPVMLDQNNFINESFGPITVPPDSLFVMGDNRDFSNDSRFWGFVPFRNVKGKAMVIWLSLWLNFSENDVTFRPSRIGTLLH